MLEGLPQTPTAAATLDAREVARFDRLAFEWWDPQGKFRPLHRIGPTRLGYLRRRLCEHFGRDLRSLRPMTGLSVLDIGCGGGLICEPMARMGAAMTGIDPAPEGIGAAKRHAAAQGLTIDYRAARVEELVREGAAFDAVLCLEVLEHVPDPAAFLVACATLVKPGGLLLASTINRTFKAYALAIVGAEYVLRWLPVGTHDWNRFITPDELSQYLKGCGLPPFGLEGIVYAPLTDQWLMSADTDVNYMIAASKAGPATS